MMTAWLQNDEPLYRDVLRLRSVSLERLKQLWDNYDGTNAPDGFMGEAIHFALNIRGEGAYCSV
jgi:hypothetical protein